MQQLQLVLLLGVTQTGIGAKMTELVALIASDSIIMLILTALICIILGMGLPATANYIVVSSLMASIVELGKQNGLIVPLVAIPSSYFLVWLADVTPQVGLASCCSCRFNIGW